MAFVASRGAYEDDLAARGVRQGLEHCSVHGHGRRIGGQPTLYFLSAMEKFYPLVEHYGYLIVFFGVMVGTTGIPFPSAAILLAAGVLVEQGHLDLTDAIVFGILGAIIGNQIGYWVGHKGGRSFVLRWGRYVKLTPERLERVERLFVRHGGKAVFAARFFSVSRVLGALIAGISRMNWNTFFLYSVLGGMVWATAVVLAGYLVSKGALPR